MHLFARYLVFAGIILILFGGLLFFAGNKFNFLGKLPGDIRLEKENGSFYFPVTTCILISLVATMLFKVLSWLFK